MFDSARLEADIASKLYIGTTISPVRDDYASPLVRDELVRSVSSTFSADTLSSPPLASTHSPGASYSRLNDMIDQPTALVFNPPPLFSVGNHSSYSVDLRLGVFGGVLCDLPTEVVRDALAISLGS